jgi:hypothetical protein
MARSGKNTYLPDRFDDVPRDVGYIGTHRRKRSSWSLFAPVGLGLGAVVVLVLAGLWFVDRSDDYLTLDPSDIAVPSGEEPPGDTVVIEPEVEVEEEIVTDPTQVDLTDFRITILNGTSTAGLAARTAERLVVVGWPEATTADADSSNVQQSVVAFAEEADRAKALGIADLLGLEESQVVQSDQYPDASVTVILGADFRDAQNT